MLKFISLFNCRRPPRILSLVNIRGISISNENKGWLLLWDLRRQIFLCFAFCSALGLCLDYDLMIVLMLMMILMPQAWFHSFVLPFVLPLCLYYRVNQALNSLLSMYVKRWNIKLRSFVVMLHTKNTLLVYMLMLPSVFPKNQPAFVFAATKRIAIAINNFLRAIFTNWCWNPFLSFSSAPLPQYEVVIKCDWRRRCVNIFIIYRNNGCYLIMIQTARFTDLLNLIGFRNMKDSTFETRLYVQLHGDKQKRALD